MHPHISCVCTLTGDFHASAVWGLLNAAGPAPAPPTSRGRHTLGRQYLAFPAGPPRRLEACHPSLGFISKTPFLLLPASSPAHGKRLLHGLLSETGATYMNKLVTRASPFPLWELGFCQVTHEAPWGSHTCPPHGCAGLLSGLTNHQLEAERRRMLVQDAGVRRGQGPRPRRHVIIILSTTSLGGCVQRPLPLHPSQALRQPDCLLPAFCVIWPDHLTRVSVSSSVQWAQTFIICQLHRAFRRIKEF